MGRVGRILNENEHPLIGCIAGTIATASLVAVAIKKSKDAIVVPSNSVVVKFTVTPPDGPKAANFAFNFQKRMEKWPQDWEISDITFKGKGRATADPEGGPPLPEARKRAFLKHSNARGKRANDDDLSGVPSYVAEKMLKTLGKPQNQFDRDYRDHLKTIASGKPVFGATTPGAIQASTDLRRMVIHGYQEKGITQLARKGARRKSISRIEVFDTLNDKQIQGVRGDLKKFDQFVRRWKSPRYIVQGLDSSGKIVIDNQGSGGKTRNFAIVGVKMARGKNRRRSFGGKYFQGESSMVVSRKSDAQRNRADLQQRGERLKQRGSIKSFRTTMVQSGSEWVSTLWVSGR